MDKPFVQTSEGIVNLLHVDFIQFRNGRGQIHMMSNREIVLSGDQFERFMEAVARYRLIDVTHAASAPPAQAFTPAPAVAAPTTAPAAVPRPVAAVATAGTTAAGPRPVGTPTAVAASAARPAAPAPPAAVPGRPPSPLEIPLS